MHLAVRVLPDAEEASAIFALPFPSPPVHFPFRVGRVGKYEKTIDLVGDFVAENTRVAIK
jgi:hypothetical protein